MTNEEFLKGIVRLKFSGEKSELFSLLDNDEYVQALLTMRDIMPQFVECDSSEDGPDGFTYEVDSSTQYVYMTWTDRENPAYIEPLRKHRACSGKWTAELPIGSDKAPGYYYPIKEGYQYCYRNELDHLVTHVTLLLMAEYLSDGSAVPNAASQSVNSQLKSYITELLDQIESVD